MDEQTIKVLARFTRIGELWPVGAWICYPNSSHPDVWHKVRGEGLSRWEIEISELEANSTGIFRGPNDV